MDIHKHDNSGSQDGVNALNMVNVHQKMFYKTAWDIDKWNFAPEVREQAEADMAKGLSKEALIEKYGAESYLGNSHIDGNLLLNAGINVLTNLLAGGGNTAFNNANARIGVGDSTTAEAASQTGLQAATNKTYQAMDASYPTYGTSQQIVFRATFGGSSANYHWQEFTVDNGTTSLNRKVSDQGTKTSGQSWQVTITITFS